MQGLDKFKEYMSGFRSHYVVIGGMATVLTLEDRGLPARATKDVDMMIICQPESKFYMKRFWEFIKAGGYKLWKPDNEEDTHPCFYRFIKPDNREFPLQVELFSKVPEYVEVPEDVHIVHIPMEGYTSSFSAIIMDDAYYDFAVNHSEIVGDIRILKPEALIVLKAVAFLENLRRKEKGVSVDLKDIDKHKKDVYRLAYVFDGSERFEVNDKIKEQLKAFISEMEKSPVDGKNMFRGQGISAMPMPDFTELLRNIFELVE
jgi:hypothetical protein